MIGKGLLTGMGITLKRFFGKGMTVQYPDVKLPMAARFRGGFLELNDAKCIVCGLCVMACPNNVLVMTNDKDENNKKRLTSYKHHAGMCLFCNLCLEACPVQALKWTQNYEMASYHRGMLTCDCLAAARQKRSQLPSASPSIEQQPPPAMAKGGVATHG